MVSDAVVLRLAGEQALAAGHTLLDPERLVEAGRLAQLGPGDVFAALRSLEAQGLANLHFVPPDRVTLLRLTGAGLRAHLATAGFDLAHLRHRVLSLLQDGTVPWHDGDPVDLAGAVGVPSLVVEVVLEDLRDAGQLVFSPAPRRRVRVHRLTPTV